MTDSLRPYRERIERQLRSFLDRSSIPARLQSAMLYGVFNGGKRIRPTLTYMTMEALGQPLQKADSAASAIELIHCYSLIHDDLPAMDDDDLRRGQATVHIKYDEATAILAGDALQTLAFELLSLDPENDAETKLALIKLITQAAGPAGMVAGQMIDLTSESKPISNQELVKMHQRKTGDLISASVMAAAVIAQANAATTAGLQCFSQNLGLAFQVRDDILDETGETAIMGKLKGADANRQKSTFTSMHGLKAAANYLDQLTETAIDALAPLGSNASASSQLLASSMGRRSASEITPNGRPGRLALVVSCLSSKLSTSGSGLLGGISKNKERVPGLQDRRNSDINANSTLKSVLFAFFDPAILCIS